MNNKFFEEILAGEITVSGQNSMTIELDVFNPEAVAVVFKPRHHHHHNVCNPNHEELIWDLSHSDGLCFLTISWNVSDVREVIWSVLS